jgi:K+ potassium transporter C-terminal domain
VPNGTPTRFAFNSRTLDASCRSSTADASSLALREREPLEGQLQAFVDELHQRDLPLVPGAAVFPHPAKQTTPLALRAGVEVNHVLPERVVIISVRVVSVPHVLRVSASRSMRSCGVTTALLGGVRAGSVPFGPLPPCPTGLAPPRARTEPLRKAYRR